MPQDNPSAYLTPPFVNPALQPQQGDPYAGLTQVLQQLQSQQYTPPKEGALQTILNALAGGASVLASNDSGAALGNLLQSRQQKQMQIEQIKQQQQQQIMVATIQAAMDKARGLQQEQAQIRQEGRQEVSANLASQRRVAETKEIDLNKLDMQAKEYEQNQLLLSKFEPDINRRKRFEAGLQAIPQQMQESLKMQTLMQTLVPDMPTEVAKSLADKQAGLTPRSFSSVENQWYSKFNNLRNDEYKTDKELARRVKESEITENEAQAIYYTNSKIQDRYANALQTNLGNATADAVDTNYFRISGPKDNPNVGSIVSQKELDTLFKNKLNSIVLRPQPLSPEETQIEMQKRVKNLKNYRNQVSQPEPTAMPGQPTITPQDPVIAQIQQLAQTKSKEEILNFILNSTMATEMKQKYVQLVTDQYGSLKGQMSPATTQKKQGTKNALPSGVNIKDFMKR